MLNRNDAPVCETASITGEIDLIDDWCVYVAGPEKISVQRVHFPPLNGVVSCTERLPKHLSAIHYVSADSLTLSAE